MSWVAMVTINYGTAATLSRLKTQLRSYNYYNYTLLIYQKLKFFGESYVFKGDTLKNTFQI